ncbi:VOC family protein [Dinoroseobacter sp. S76]|uniref:VOC family protein n=1 Tax=Dinoroseobacter sp. S76 TaxID=3415124 RepID=UPI003C799211
MRVTQYYPVIQSDAVAETAEFYKRHFGFRAAFAADWYVHLQSEADPAVNLAVVQSDHETIPAPSRGAAAGMILNFEVEDVDQVDARLRSEGVEVAKPLVSEPFGQRHAIYRDPNGVLIDVITPIPPSEEFLAQYAADAVPG